jgi:hypothetical protein
MFEYGEGFFEQNKVILEQMRQQMSPAAWTLAIRMAEELLEEEDT